MINLHCHSVYSVLDGLLSTDKLASMGEKSGAIALTDHGTCAGHVTFYQNCIKHKVKPILGVEAYITSENGRHHLTVLANNNQGYQDLLRIQANAANKLTKYPIVDIKELSKASSNFTILTGCSSGIVISESDTLESAENILQHLSELFVNLYVEFQPNTDYMPFYHNANHAAQKLGIPAVITTDIHYEKPEDNETYRNIHKILMHKESTLNLNWLYLWEDQELYNYFSSQGFTTSFFKQCLKNIEGIAANSNVQLTFDRKWNFPTDVREIWDKCTSKLFEIGKGDNIVYAQRLSYEFAILKNLNLLGYLNFCSNILQHCKDNNIPYGPGRGSCVGSLMCYLLNITEVDPIVNELSFERFLSPSSTKGLYSET